MQTDENVPELPEKRNSFCLYAAIIIGCVAVVCIVLLFKSALQWNHHVVARVSQDVDAQWVSADGNLTLGSELYPGSYVLQSGLAEITLNGGTRIILEAPVKFDLETSSQINLEIGRLVVIAQQGSSDSLVVRTANAITVDLGAEFGVEYDSLGQTSVHVFKGIANVFYGQPKAGLLLKAGQACKVNPGGFAIQVNANMQLFVTQLPPEVELEPGDPNDSDQ